jgi:hypothetical protein
MITILNKILISQRGLGWETILRGNDSDAARPVGEKQDRMAASTEKRQNRHGKGAAFLRLSYRSRVVIPTRQPTGNSV